MDIGNLARVTDKDDRPPFQLKNENHVETIVVGRAFPPKERDALLKACEVRQGTPPFQDNLYPEHPEMTARDKAALGLAFIMGLRVDEVCKLRVKFIQRTARKLVIVGKTGMRIVPFLTPSMQLVDDWLMFRGSEEGHLFCQVDRYGNPHVSRKVNLPFCEIADDAGLKIGGCGFDFKAAGEARKNATGRPYYHKTCPECGLERPYDMIKTQMVTTSLQEMLTKRQQIAGIDVCTWHDGRRTMITTLSNFGPIGEKLAQTIAGHKDPATTASYRRYNDEELIEAILDASSLYAEMLGMDIRPEYLNGDEPSE